MSGVLDGLLVGLALLASAAYAAASLGPRSWRKRGAASLSRAAARLPERYGLRRGALRLVRSAAGEVKAACGGCDGCEPQAPGAPPAGGGETRIPLARVGRRSRA